MGASRFIRILLLIGSLAIAATLVLPALHDHHHDHDHPGTTDCVACHHEKQSQTVLAVVDLQIPFSVDSSANAFHDPLAPSGETHQAAGERAPPALS
jgi:hypothetical protein